LDNKRVDTITKADCEAWAKRYADKYSAQFFNYSRIVFREILSLAGLGRDANPAYKIKRRGVPRKQLDLPTADQFNQILAEIETAGAIDEKARADFVRFLAFSGCRLNEAKQALWQDVDWQKNELTIHCLKRRATSDEVRSRAIPLVPAMRQLLTRMHGERQPKPEDTICRVFVCRKPLIRACKRIGCAPLTHHSLRHLFATFCIEAGIDIPSVSRWLGHSDGGALAMRVYGHLRREHSQLMAQRVTFGQTFALPQ
jgi:integrase